MQKILYKFLTTDQVLLPKLVMDIKFLLTITNFG